MKYTPDGFNILKSGKDFYVFGSWAGGYLEGDSWRRNSGITRIVEYQENGLFKYDIYGWSGSVYSVVGLSEGRITNYNRNVLNSIIKSQSCEVVSLRSLLDELECKHLGGTYYEYIFKE